MFWTAFWAALGVVAAFFVLMGGLGVVILIMQWFEDRRRARYKEVSR